MKPADNKKNTVNRVEMVTEDRTKYFGENKTLTDTVKAESENKKNDLNLNVPKNMNAPLTINKKKSDSTQQEEHRRYRGGTGNIFLICGILLAAGILGGSLYYFKDKVAVNMPKTQKTDTYKIKGLIQGDEKTVLSEIEGKITEMSLEKGTPVKQGELLITIENPKYKEDLEKAEKDLRAVLTKNAYTQVVTEEIKSVPVTTKKVVPSRQKTYSNEILIAEEKFRNDKEAYNAGLISRVEYEKSLSRITKARANEKNPKSVVVTETKVVNTKIEHKKQIPADKEKVLSIPEVAEAIAKYKKAFSDYESTKIFAVNSGLITDLYVKLNQYVSKGQKLFKSANSNYLYTEVVISDKKLKKAGRGNVVKLLSDIDNKEYEGIITDVKPAAEKRKSIIKIIVADKNKGTMISAGSHVTVIITNKTALKEMNEIISKQKQGVKNDQKQKVSKIADEKAGKLIDEVLK